MIQGNILPPEKWRQDKNILEDSKTILLPLEVQDIDNEDWVKAEICVR